MIKKITFLLGVILLFSCSSSPTRSQFYTLHGLSPSEGLQTTELNKNISIGIGPIKLPRTLQRKQVLSYSEGQGVNIASHAYWTEDLVPLVSRVVSLDLSVLTGSNNIWAFPWSIEDKPQIQVPLTIIEMGGVLGGEVVLSAKWKVVNSATGEASDVYDFYYKQAAANKSYEAYTAAINQLLHNLSEAVVQTTIIK